MKKIIAISFIILLSTTKSANADHADFKKKFVIVSQKSAPSASQKLKPTKGRQYSSHSTKTDQVLAILKEGENRKLPKKTAQHFQDEMPLLENNTKSKNNSSSFDKIVTYSKDKNKKISTQGHYVSLDTSLNRVSYYERSSVLNFDVPDNNRKPENVGYGYGIGVSYKYAMNFNGFFVAPGIFYEKMKVSAYPNRITYSPEESALGSLRIKNKYGVTSDIGYDINNRFSPYVVLGYSMVHYAAQSGVGYVGEGESVTTNATSGGFLYGAGLKIKYDEKIAYNIEFNVQKFQTRNKKTANDADFDRHSVFRAKLKSLKLGVSYHF